MAAEAEAHGGQDFLGEGVLLARPEAGEQRRGQHVGRHGFLDRRFHGPAAFPRILDLTRERIQLLVLGQRVGG